MYSFQFALGPRANYDQLNQFFLIYTVKKYEILNDLFSIYFPTVSIGFIGFKNFDLQDWNTLPWTKRSNKINVWNVAEDAMRQRMRQNDILNPSPHGELLDYWNYFFSFKHFPCNWLLGIPKLEVVLSTGCKANKQRQGKVLLILSWPQ